MFEVSSWSRLITTGLWLLLLSVPVLAQPLDLKNHVHQQWTQLSNEPFPAIFGLAQDTKQTIWLATFAGLIKFDGVDFLPVFTDQQNNFHRGHISAVVVMPNDDIYFIPVNKGLGRISGPKLEHFNQQNGLLCDRIDKITVDKQGQLWYACAKGIVRFGPNPIVHRFKHNNLHITALMVISETEFLYGTNLGQLYHVDGDQQTQWDDLPQANVLTLFQLGENHWLFSIREHGIFSLSNGKISRPKQYLPLAGANVEKILSDSSGALWMATTLGVVRFIGEQMQIMTFDEQSARQQKVQSRIFSLLLDADKALWAGFYAKGLHRLTPPKVNVIPQMSVRTVVEYDEAYWMGTDLQGIAIKYHNGETAHLTTKDGLPSNTVHALYPDADGNLWLGTTKGLAKYHQGQITHWDLTQYGLSNWVTTLTSSKNDEIWIGTDNGVATIKNGQITSKGDLGKSGKRRVRWLKRGLNGVMWAGTMDGVAFYQAGRWQNPPQSILSDYAQVSFYLDKDGGKWFGSQQGDGLSWLKNNKLTRFTTIDGLFDNLIWTITEDASGYLWLSSDKGINRIKRVDLENHAIRSKTDNKSASKQKILSTTFGRNEGLNPSECNSASPAPWHTLAKKLIFPCMAGLVEIDPQSLPTTQGVPTNAIDYIVFDGNTRWLPNSQNLNAEQRDIRIKYSATGFDNPDKIQFKYRLLGYQAQWQSAQNRRQVSFTNLSAGDYVFEVTSRFYNGHWGQVSAKLPLSIAPHFYERRWFHLLILLATSYLVHYLYQHKLNLALRRQTEIEAARIDHLSNLVHNVAHNLNTPVGIAITGASMLPDYSAKLKHMMDTGIISKKGLNELIDGLEASGSVLSKSLTTVSDLVERFKQLNIHTYSDQSSLIDITQLMLDVKAEVAFKHPNRIIDWQIEHPPTLTFTSYSEVLSQVLQLLADNTLKHGYPASPEVKAEENAIINIQFERNKKTLKITYQDFGNGMTQQELASLFIPFGNRIGDQKGLGLGMNIAYNLITQKLCGRIAAPQRNEPGVLFDISFEVE